MNYMIIDTANDVANYAIRSGGKDYVMYSPKGDRHSESVLKYIDKLLTESGLGLKDIDVFGVNIGPGSFTGVRIGLSVLKGFLAGGLSAKVVAFNSLEVLGEGRRGVVCFRASRDDFFAGDANIDKVTNVRVMTNAEIDALSEKYESTDFNVDAELDITERKAVAGDFVDINTLAPIYLKLSQAERMLKENGSESK